MTLLMTKPMRKVYWTDDEKRRLIKAGRAIRRADPTRGDLATLKKAMREVLTRDRHRPLKTVPRFRYQWFIDGIEADMPREPEPIPVPALPALPEIPDAGVILNRMVLDAVQDMREDFRRTAEALAALAREGAATHVLLIRVVAALDPGLLPDPAPTPVAVAEPEPEPPARAPKLPRIAVVAPNRSQVAKIRDELRPYAEVRIFETAQHALRQRLGGCQYVICTQNDMTHKVTQLAESLVGKSRVHFLGKSGANAIIERAMDIVERHRQTHEEERA